MLSTYTISIFLVNTLSFTPNHSKKRDLQNLHGVALYMLSEPS